MPTSPPERRSPAHLLDLALANVAAQQRWSLVPLDPTAAISVCVSESGSYIHYPAEEPGRPDGGILVRGASMWVAGDLWQSQLFGSRMVLPAAVKGSGKRWLRCETRFGLAKIGEPADPVAVLRRACTWYSLTGVQPGAEPGGYRLTGKDSSVDLVDHPRAGLVVAAVREHGADHVTVDLDVACVLPDPAPDDTLERVDVTARKAPAARKRAAPARPLDLDLHHDADAEGPDFPWVVSSYEIIDALGLATAHDVEALLVSDGHLGDELANDVIFDSPGEELIAFCRTREAGERLIAALQSLS